MTLVDFGSFEPSGSPGRAYSPGAEGAATAGDGTAEVSASYAAFYSDPTLLA